MAALKFLAFCVLFACFPGASDATAQAASQTNLFEFHSGFWINLHHFLYQQAHVEVTRKGPRPASLTAADSAALEGLSLQERENWSSAVGYYTRELAKRDLLFDDGLITIKNNLEDAETSPDLAGVLIPPQLKAVLLSAAPIYRKYWWRAHDAANRKWIAELTPLVQRYGSTISARMIAIYSQPWPQYPVRVDSVAYANWAGAYTTLEPTRPTISTSAQANQGVAALEIVFHETSHGMMDKVMQAIGAAEANINAHRSGNPYHSGSIWHAVLFYTAGELVSEQIPGYVAYADKNGLWIRAWPAPDRAVIEQDWKPHINRASSLEPALTKLVADLASASSH
ncbi:MAG: hypothetical protein WBE41_13040 [Terracidiphilus sp.]